MAQDLVCGMDVDEKERRFFSDYANNMYYFCSPECKRKFDDHPDQYIREDAKDRLGLG